MEKEGRNYRTRAVTPVGTDVETAWENIKRVYLESDDLQELIRNYFQQK